MLCSGVWEVQVEGRLRRAKQLVRQVHVDIWTEKYKKNKEKSGVSEYLKVPKIQFHSPHHDIGIWGLIFVEITNNGSTHFVC